MKSTKHAPDMDTQTSIESVAHPHLQKLLADVAATTAAAQQVRADLSDDLK